MKISIRYQLLLITLLILSGCGIYMNVYSDYDHSINFKKYKTFAWLMDKDSTNDTYNNQIIRSNTRNYFTFAMADRGYKIDIDSPDVFLDLIVTNVKTGITVDVPVYPNYPSWYVCNPYYQQCPPMYFYQSPYFYNYSVTHIKEYREFMEGSITLNIIDRKLNKLVWTGTAKGDLYDPEYMQDNIHPAVHRILQKYPVKPLKKKQNASGQ